MVADFWTCICSVCAIAQILWDVNLDFVALAPFESAMFVCFYNFALWPGSLVAMYCDVIIERVYTEGFSAHGF